MKEITLTADQEQVLREQVITTDQPGAVLHDFQMLLDFLTNQGGVETSGKFNLLPLKYFGELNAGLSRPLHLALKRPKLKSHPYLQGLNLLLRSSGLSWIEQAGAKARLVLEPAMLAQWNALNPTERYFSLLEAWLRIARPEMVGENGRIWTELLRPCLQAWKWLPDEGQQFDIQSPTEAYFVGIDRDFYQLALMDLFGVVKVEQPVRPTTPWCPASVSHVPFGDALFTLLHNQHSILLKQGVAEVDDDEESAPEVDLIGAWQPLFQPYFPEWRRSLTFPQAEAREGTFIFRVSLGEVWRLLAIAAEDTLDDLMVLILRSFKFDHDHLYSFHYRGRMGTNVLVNHPDSPEGPWTDEVEIGALPLEPGQSMGLRYDYGDNWRFTITLIRIEPPGSATKAPRILERHGKSPEQYPGADAW